MIFYSHVNEDNELEKAFMNENQFENLVCIIGSGERLIALLGHPGLKHVYAIDSNVETLYLLELKLKALEHLSVEAYLAFIGFSDTKDRIKQFEKFKDMLSQACRQYWLKRQNEIRKGILFIGHFERFLEKLRPMTKRFLGESFYNQFETNPKDKAKYYSWQWSFIKYLFSKRWIYLLAGNKDQAFIDRNAVRRLIPDGMQKIIDENLVEQSFMFHLIFKGHLREMNKDFLPPTLQMDHLKNVKCSLEEKKITINFCLEDLKAFLVLNPISGSNNTFYSFSDILSFCDFEYLMELFQFLNKNKTKEKWGCFRAFLRNRLTVGQVQMLENHTKVLEEVSAQEKTKMYQVFKFKL